MCMFATMRAKKTITTTFKYQYKLGFGFGFAFSAKNFKRPKVTIVYYYAGKQADLRNALIILV